jgi:ankyrin repeat protein
MIALKRAVAAIITVAALVLAVPAAAQNTTGFEGAQFVKAIQDGKSDDALKLFQANPTLVNARDLDGQTALIAAIDNRDEQWAGYLLQQGADPNLPGKNGETPLIAAARTGFEEAADWLVRLGAKVDSSNRAGETALIIAVQRRQLPIVRILVKAGADPDKTDNVAGYSARDYAKRDNRTPELLRIIESGKTKP